MNYPQKYLADTSSSFMDGCFLYVNGIQNSVLVYRGEECIENNYFGIFKEHDYFPHLSMNESSPTLITTTETLHANMLGVNVADIIQEIIQGCKNTPIDVIILCELPFFSHLGNEIDFYANALEQYFDVPCISIRNTNLERTFYDAYDEISYHLVKKSIQDNAITESGDDIIGFLGFPYYRNEMDAIADANVISKLVLTMTGKTPLLFPAGNSYHDLKQIMASNNVFIFPHNQSGKTVSLLKEHSINNHSIKNYPLSISLTRSFLEDICYYLGIKQVDKVMIEKMENETYAIINVLKSKYLMGKKVFLIAESKMIDGIVDCFSNDLGLIVVGFIRKNELDGSLSSTVSNINDNLKTILNSGDIDLIIGSYWDRRVLHHEYSDIPFYEWGYPQMERHYIVPAPIFGYDGVINWAHSLSNVLMANV